MKSRFRPARRDLYAIGFLMLLIAVVFGGALTAGFIQFDDYDYVVKNPQVTAGLSWAGLRWALGAIVMSNWHPLTLLSLQADATLFGGSAWGFHLHNILLHAATSTLLFLALRRSFGAFWRSLLVTILFAVHPARVESVVWVAERKDVLSALFWMLTWHAYLGYLGRPTPTRFLAVAGAYAAGLLAKPMLVTLPFALLLLDFWPFGRWAEERRRVLTEKLPLLGMSAVVCMITLRAQTPAMLSLDFISPAIRLLFCGPHYFHYLIYLLAPLHSSFYRPQLQQAFSHSLLQWGAIGALTIGALAAWRQRPHLTMGWLWFLGTLVPVIGMVRVGSAAMAERYTYLPSIGVFLALAWETAAWSGRARRLIPAMAGLLALLYSVAAWRQVAVWQDETTLWKQAIAFRPGNYVPTLSLLRIYGPQKRFEEAESLLREAVAVDEADMQFPTYQAKVQAELAYWYGQAGNDRQALVHFSEALRLDPAFAAYFVNAAIACTHLDQWADATALALRASQMDLRRADHEYLLKFADKVEARGDKSSAERLRSALAGRELGSVSGQ